MWKYKFFAALKRAGWTAAEVALAMIPVGVGVEEVNWIHICSVVVVAAVISLLKSVVVNTPEVKLAEEVKVQAQTIQSLEVEEEPNPDRPSK